MATNGESPVPNMYHQEGLMPSLNSTDASGDSLLIELNTLRYELATVRQERELEKLGIDREIRELQRRIQEDGKTIENERNEKNFLFERHQALALDLEKARGDFIEEKVKLEADLRESKSLSRVLNERLHDVEAEASTLRRKANHDTEELHAEIKQLRESLGHESATKESLEITVQELQSKIKRMETDSDQLPPDGYIKRSQSADSETLALVQRELAVHIKQSKHLESLNRALEQEVHGLREISRGVSILQEEKRVLETKIETLQGLHEAMSNLELQNSILEQERASWAAFLQDESNNIPFDSPAHLARAYIQEKMEKQLLLDRYGRSNPLIHEKEDQIVNLLEQNRGLEELISELKANLQKDSKARQRLERQRELALKEATFLREQLKTYSTEEATLMTSNYDDQKSRRIEELERLLSEHQTETENLIRQLKDQESIAGNGADALSQRNLSQPEHAPIEGSSAILNTHDEELNNLQQAHRMALIEMKALQRQLAAAEATSRMRVLQLKENPTSQIESIKADMLRSLKKENSDLLAQVSGQSGGPILVPMSTLENLRTDMKEMERLVAEKEKRMSRLKEMWSKKAQEFRQAVYSILGYEVDFQPNGRVKVTSIFHRPDFYGGVDTGIIFDGEQGTMKLCGGPNSQFAREIKNQLKFYVEERKEIPCFLAALTMEGYEKTTRAQR